MNTKMYRQKKNMGREIFRRKSVIQKMQRWKIQRQNVLTKCTTENDQMKKWGKWMTKKSHEKLMKTFAYAKCPTKYAMKTSLLWEVSHGPQCVVSKKSDRMEVSTL